MHHASLSLAPPPARGGPSDRMVERDAARPRARTPDVKRVMTLVVAGWLLLSASCTGATQPGTEPSDRAYGYIDDVTEQRVGSADVHTAHRPTTQIALVTAELRNELVVVSLPGGRVFAASRSPPILRRSRQRPVARSRLSVLDLGPSR